MDDTLTFRFLVLLLVASVCRSWSVYGPFSNFSAGRNVTKRTNLVALAKKLNLTSLVDALRQTKLDNVVDHEGPFTLFAPTNDAFARRPDYCFNVPLKDVMKMHVGRGFYFSKKFKNDELIPTLLSERTIRINVYRSNEIVTGNGREIIKVDNVASNGVLHILNDVMCSLYIGSAIVEINRCPSFSKFSRAVNMTNLYTLLDAKGPYTVFTPTDDAVAKLPSDFIIHLLNNITALKEVILYHIIPQVWYSPGFQDGLKLKTLQGSYVTLKLQNVIRINNATVTLPDATVSNGVVHSIDTVLIPPSLYINN
ncbi:transforming growth factor-beta-induced protein ig-h3-like [Centruroides vittatus]|uniref:transforming growth factor-beta-induced protein ig-h3-like n=1 Tax=Centruroides vittatus TaxID=120091 RepID=UPI00350FC83E